jgi:NTE family protein
MTNSTTTTRTPAPRRLALVLGSGGVRSVAALGIADVLASEGLRPDLLVGCSSGAIFAATLAMGLSSRDSLALATQLWSADLTQQKRWKAYAQLLAPKLFGFDAGFSLRDARSIGNRIGEAFDSRLLQDLPTPLRVVTTETATGNCVVLTRGRICDALRASVALPFVFPSVEIDGRRLSDGVLSNPLPVGVANDARVVLALGFEGRMPRRIDRPSRLVAQVSTAMINNLQRTHLLAAKAAGQRVLSIEGVLSTELDRRIGLWDTAAMPRIFEAGRKAALRYLPEIHALVGNGSAQQAA